MPTGVLHLKEVDTDKITLDGTLSVSGTSTLKESVIESNVSVGGTATFAAPVEATNVNVSGTLSVAGQTTIGGDIIPDTNDAYDIGSPEFKIRDMYVSDNSLWIGDTTKISNVGGSLKFRKRKTSEVPKAIIDAGASAGHANAQATADAALAHAGVGHISQMRLQHWHKFMRTLNQAAQLTDIFRNDDDDYEETSASDAWKEVNGNEIYTNYNVGVGTSDPDDTLHVKGSFKVESETGFQLIRSSVGADDPQLIIDTKQFGVDETIEDLTGQGLSKFTKLYRVYGTNSEGYGRDWFWGLANDDYNNISLAVGGESGGNDPDLAFTFTTTSELYCNKVFAALGGNADTATLAAAATRLETPRKINGVNFDGTQDITLSSDASKLATPVNINGVPFDGSGDININEFHGDQPIKKLTPDSSPGTYSYVLNAPRPGTSTGGAVHFINGAGRSDDGGASTYTIRNDSGTLVLGHSNQTTRIVGDVEFDAHVGIGKTDPGYPLDVNGSIRMSAHVYAHHLNMSHGRADRNSDNTFYSSTDNYLRKNTASGMISSLGIDNRYIRKDVDNTVGTNVALTWLNSEDPALRCQNASYNAWLMVGGWSTDNSNDISRVRASNGNLHIDSAANGSLYCNWYTGGSIQLGRDTTVRGSITATSIGFGTDIGCRIEKSGGDYMTVTTVGSKGEWGGYNIQNQWGLMAHTNGNHCGIYNDLDNEWGMYCDRNSHTRLHYNNGEKLRTENWGVFVHGETRTSTLRTTGTMTLNYNNPTIYFQDTDNNSAMIHVNSNIFYILRGGTNSTSWTQVNGRWPLEINLTNNNATFGGSVTATSFSGPASTLLAHSYVNQLNCYSSTYGAGYSTAALEIREYNLQSSNGGTEYARAPRIGFHWGARVASQLVLESSGIIACANNPGNDYQKFKCSEILTTSDDRIKTNERYINNATETLLKLKPQIYDKGPIDSSTVVESETSVESGLIAQDVYYDTPELRHLVFYDEDAKIPKQKPYVDKDPQKDPDYSMWGSKSAGVNYNGFIAYLVKSIQEIHTELESTKKELYNLKTQIEFAPITSK